MTVGNRNYAPIVKSSCQVRSVALKSANVLHERRNRQFVEGFRGVAQLVERRSPKPQVVGSSPAAPAIFQRIGAKTSAAELSGRGRRAKRRFFIGYLFSLVKGEAGVYVGTQQTRGCVGLSEFSFTRRNCVGSHGIQNQSGYVSAPGALRGVENPLAVAPRDDDLDGDGDCHGGFCRTVFLRCRPIDGLAPAPRPQRQRLILENKKDGGALVHRPRIF